MGGKFLVREKQNSLHTHNPNLSPLLFHTHQQTWCVRNKNLVREKQKLGARETKIWCARNKNLVREKQGCFEKPL